MPIAILNTLFLGMAIPPEGNLLLSYIAQREMQLNYCLVAWSPSGLVGSCITSKHN